MHRNKWLTSPRHAETSEISTQEYIRRVEEDDNEEFSRNPWVFALDILRRDDGVEVTPLRTVKQCGGVVRIDKVVAIVKSCKPNGLGDMMVTLKDPTDTVDASVHKKVLSTGEHGNLIAVGSVLILKKVVAFYSSCASCYLNITRSNVVKVINVDCAMQSFSEANGCPSDLEIPEKTSSLAHRRPEAHFGDDQPSYLSKGRTVAEELMEKENCSQTVSLISSRQIENAANKISKEPIHIDSVDSGLKWLGWFSKVRDESCRSTQPAPSIGEGLARNHEDLDDPKKLRQVRDFSSAPKRTEYLDSQHAWRANGAKMGSLLRDSNCITSMADRTDVHVDSSAGASSRAKNLDDLDISRANDVKEQKQHGDTIAPPYIVKNLANQEIHKPNDPQKRRQPPESTNVIMDSTQDQEADVAKKQKLAFISRTSVQEWTDEQLGILDMDED